MTIFTQSHLQAHLPLNDVNIFQCQAPHVARPQRCFHTFFFFRPPILAVCLRMTFCPESMFLFSIFFVMCLQVETCMSIYTHIYIYTLFWLWRTEKKIYYIFIYTYFYIYILKLYIHGDECGGSKTSKGISWI